MVSGSDPMAQRLTVLFLILFCAACAPTLDRLSSSGTAPGWSQNGANGLRPQIVSTAAHLECVPYAREQSGIPIRGDAWTWWQSADGLYQRSRRPSIGSVLVLSRGGHLNGGHLAVVTAILNSREIVVRHANWLNRGQIHIDTPVIDVSGANDWSAVRVWYTPGATYGARTYPASGFIHPERLALLSGQG